MAEPIIEVESKEKGRNAKVRLYPDRIEREKPRSLNSWSKAAQDIEVTPIRSVSSVQAQKDGLSTKVTVFATGNPIEFRIFPHEAAHRFKDEILKLVLGGPQPSASAASGSSRLEQLQQLGELKASGVLSEEEFAAEKARIMADEPAASSAPAAGATECGSESSSSGSVAGRAAAAIATGGITEAARFLRRKK